MARPKKQPDPRPIDAAQHYLSEHAPDLGALPLHIQALDGPPDAPRYMITGEHCGVVACPHGITPEAAAQGLCPVTNCPLRQSVCLLIDQQYQVLKASRSGIKWGHLAPPRGDFDE
ncbi:MAG TPA: hypothetical protein VFS21_18590 [Roseiflexaceae bacterium]|nr:hypothetical protein [Roseiflexaceae bacterium]